MHNFFTNRFCDPAIRYYFPAFEFSPCEKGRKKAHCRNLPVRSRVLKVVDVRDFLTDWRDTLSGDGYEYELRQNEPRNMSTSKSIYT